MKKTRNILGNTLLILGSYLLINGCSSDNLYYEGIYYHDLAKIYENMIDHTYIYMIDDSEKSLNPKQVELKRLYNSNNSMNNVMKQIGNIASASDLFTEFKDSLIYEKNSVNFDSTKFLEDDLNNEHLSKIYGQVYSVVYDPMNISIIYKNEKIDSKTLKQQLLKSYELKDINSIVLYSSKLEFIYQYASFSEICTIFDSFLIDDFIVKTYTTDNEYRNIEIRPVFLSTEIWKNNYKNITIQNSEYLPIKDFTVEDNLGILLIKIREPKLNEEYKITINYSNYLFNTIDELDSGSLKFTLK